MADKKEVKLGLPENSAGAAPVDAVAQRSSSAHAHNGRSASNRDAHWLSQGAGAEDGLAEGGGRDSSTEPGKDNGGLSAKDREERLRVLKERQNEDRQKKLEELKQQALAAQKFREQKEEERRRRMDELRQRDTDRRSQVEERKRQIWEAERDRREAILRKNQEREARIDSKRKNERSSIVFAFGSSTPRMLEPADTGGSFWGTRRATSTTNVMMFTAAPLTRRASERELDGSKKRATSASGLDRKPGEGDEGDGAAPNTPGSTAYSSATRVNRRKTDLMPTIPSPRDLTPTSSSSRPSSVHPQQNRPFSRSPGRAYSMSRLDVLSQPRRRDKPPMPIPTAATTTPNKSMSRSMSHLAGRSILRCNDASRSMSQLCPPPPVPPPRPTRAERLRQRAREAAARGQSAPSSGLRSGEATPSPPSRPLSALSQQSMSSVNSGVNLRPRPVAAPRKPRPISIAVTGVSQDTDTQQARALHRHSIAGEIRSAKPQSSIVDKEGAKPPLPKVHAAKKKPETPVKKPTDKILKSAKASPRVTPKATPLQSPGSEAPPSLAQDQAEAKIDDILVVVDEPKKLVEQESEASEPSSAASVTSQEAPAESLIKVSEEQKLEPVQNLEPAVRELEPTVQKPEPAVQKPEPAFQKPEPAVQKPEPAVQKPEPAVHKLEPAVQSLEPVTQELIPVSQEQESPARKPEPVQKAEPVQNVVVESVRKQDTIEVLEHPEQEVDMTASMIAKIRITTEEEAKAAMAERRRFAREQAEREAELERLRLEEEERQEEERQRQEEEEQRRFEEEQLRLVSEARQAEEERLLQAIQENERREEEEKKRREEEAKAKIEKEEADKKAREEAERLRKEMDERLKKEEEERIARRKRVEAIMLRTRGKGATPTSTPTKGQPDGDGDLDEGKDENLISVGGEIDEASGQSVHQENGKVSSSELLLIDNGSAKPMEISEDSISVATSVLPHSNGHRNGMEYSAVDFVNVDNVKQNNTTNNLLDLSEFDAYSTNNVMQQPVTETTGEFEQILDLSSVPATGKLVNEDNVNSNVTNNGPNAPFIAFQDSMAKKQDNSSVGDLLS